jgi:prepilin-type N-terminal cleavage/methylation domain-containing protein
MNKNGFTLLEVIVVVAIIGLIAGIGIPQINRVFRTNLKTTSTQISSMIKYSYDAAIINHMTYRIAFDFSSNTYHLEVSKSQEGFLLDAEEDKKESILYKDEKQKKENNFAPYSGEWGRAVQLPQNLKIENIVDVKTRKEYSSDIFYLYFFPHGQTQEVIIRLNGEKAKIGFYSIWVDPITARCTVEGRYLDI